MTFDHAKYSRVVRKNRSTVYFESDRIRQKHAEPDIVVTRFTKFMRLTQQAEHIPKKPDLPKPSLKKCTDKPLAKQTKDSI